MNEQLCCGWCNAQAGEHRPERFNTGLSCHVYLVAYNDDYICQHCNYELWIYQRAGVDVSPDSYGPGGAGYDGTLFGDGE
jgi:hypothetical protein